MIPILIASTLKPIRDVRAYEKLALSLGETNKYRLNIIGFSPKKPKSDSKIRFFSSMSHYHSFWDRVLAQARFGWTLVKVRPKVLITCTYEYLPLAKIFKSILGYKLIYDVQENYLANLSLNPHASNSKKQIAWKLIQWAETTKLIDLYLFAEASYRIDMPTKTPFLILENKFQGQKRVLTSIHYADKRRFKFCITGTITPSYGINEAINWFEKIQKAYPGSTLKLCGHVPIPFFETELEEKASQIPGIILAISPEPISHAQILPTLLEADFSLLPYPMHAAIKDKIPTKLFECAALSIPVLITPNPIWANFLDPFQGGASVDFNKIDTAVEDFSELIHQFYFSTLAPGTVLWASEKLHFQKAIQNLLT